MLRSLARKAEMEPLEYLVDLVRRHPTLADAASAADVSEETFRRWRRRFRIEVQS